MRIGRQEGPDGVTLIIVGELDFSTSETLRETVLQKAPGKEIILDLRAMDFIDSSGAGMLVQLAKELSEKKKLLHIVNIPDDMKESLELIGFFSVLEAIFSPQSNGKSDS
ncbi:MAG: STAS domain-containing protein [Bacillota bacterium]